MIQQTHTQGDFARTEDAIFEALDLGVPIQDHALAIYDALLSLDEATLKQGGLTRDEVLESRTELS